MLIYSGNGSENIRLNGLHPYIFTSPNLAFFAKSLDTPTSGLLFETTHLTFLALATAIKPLIYLLLQLAPYKYYRQSCYFYDCFPQDFPSISTWHASYYVNTAN